MKLTNAMNKLARKGYEVKKENGVYTFQVDGFDYNFREQDGEINLLHIHVDYSDHPRFFPNLKQILEYAESRVKKDEANKTEIKKEKQEREERNSKRFQILNENGLMIVSVKTLEEAKEIKEIYEQDGKEYIIKKPAQETKKIEEKQEVELTEVAEIVEEIEKDILKVGQKIMYNEILYIVKIVKNGMVGMVAVWSKAIGRIIRTTEAILNKVVEVATKRVKKQEPEMQKPIVKPKAKRKSSFRRWLELMIDEKGADLEGNIKIDGHFGLTWTMLLDFLEQVPEYHKDFKHNLVYIDFKNGDIFHYLTHLAKGMIKSCNSLN
jgi:hypothetical protein